MKKKLIGIIIICTFFQSFNVIAQPRGCDPWIVAIYKELYQRIPTVEECSIKNYNKGSWSSYDQLKELIKAYQKASVTLSPASVTGDPWITAIYKSLYQRLPNSWELNIYNYNGGSWKSYDELTSYIRDFQLNLQKNGIIIETAMLSVDKSLVAFKKDGVYIAANLLSNKNGSIIAAGGGNIVAAGGGNIVAAGGGNIVAAGGGNIVAAGGGNIVAAGGGNIVFKVGTGLAGAFHGSQYSLQSGAKLQVPASGKTSLVFK
ncbi:MAG TPA: hypothetical protein PL108_01530 [Sediminibacterium sp.]|nr:hypothetical protein [Sediminibacterium sp.]